MMRTLDILALGGIAAGIGLLLQPWWPGGFRCGFFLTMGFTILHIVTSHLNQPDAP